VWSVENELKFRRNMLLPSSGSKNKPSNKSDLIAACFHAGFLLGLFFDPEDRGDMVPPKRRLTFN
jgi:hypothetical protein